MTLSIPTFIYSTYSYLWHSDVFPDIIHISTYTWHLWWPVMYWYSLMTFSDLEWCRVVVGIISVFLFDSDSDSVDNIVETWWLFLLPRREYIISDIHSIWNWPDWWLLLIFIQWWKATDSVLKLWFMMIPVVMTLTVLFHYSNGLAGQCMWKLIAIQPTEINVYKCISVV